MKQIKTENDVKALVKQWFKDRGGWSYAPVQNGLGEHGIHDRVGCIPIVVTHEMVGTVIGQFVSIECKKPGRRGEPNRGMSKNQIRVMDEVYDAYGKTIVCDGQDDLDRLDSPIWRRFPNGA